MPRNVATTPEDTMTIKFEQFDAQLGIHTRVHETENKFVIEKTFDAEPFLKEAAELRAVTAGERWSGGTAGLGKKVGTIPMSVMATFYRQDGGFDHKRATAWLKANPAFVTFDKFLKV